MTRRHNRHFYLDDDLTQCRGAARYFFVRCSNWGGPNAQGLYWCHIHKEQEAPRAKRP